MQPHDKLHILAYGTAVVTARGNDSILFEKPESPGDYQRTVEFIEHNARSQKGTVVFQNLHTGDKVSRETVFFHPSVFQLHAV